MTEGHARPLRADRGQLGEHGRRGVHPGPGAASRATSPRPSSSGVHPRCCGSRRTSTCRSPARRELVANLRAQLEALNGITFSDAEWERFFTERIAGDNDGHRREDGPDPGGPRPAPQPRRRLDQEHHADRQDEHPQQPAAGHQPVRGRQGEAAPYANRYDVTVLVNGLPMVHIELKRRGRRHPRGVQPDRPLPARQLLGGVRAVRVRAAVRHQQRHADEVLLATPPAASTSASAPAAKRARKTSNSFEFTSWWADATNKPIQDLAGFAKTFFAKHTLLNILTKYCVLTADRMLLVMRPYQIVATERILQTDRRLHQLQAARHDRRRRLRVAHDRLGQDADELQDGAARDASCPTSTRCCSSSTARTSTTRRCASTTASRRARRTRTPRRAVLKKQLEDPARRIIITTIQKLGDLHRRATRATRSTTATS